MQQDQKELEEWILEWNCGKLKVQSLGGMLGPIHFELKTSSGDKQIVQPMMIAPWNSDTNEQKKDLPPILQNLKGEWPCVPFGSARKVENLNPNWEKNKWEQSEGFAHGASSNLHWKAVSQSKQELVLECIYPLEQPIEKLVRKIHVQDNFPRVEIELEVYPREDCNLPIGLHPTFDIHEPFHSIELSPGKYSFGITFPGDLEPSSIAKPDSKFDSLTEVPLKDGQTQDFSKLPIDKQTENLLLLCNIDGNFNVKYLEEQYEVHLAWKPEHFPTVLLWLSNKGRPAYPWSSRFYGCGIEPLCAAFDLGNHVSSSKNPLNEMGVQTSTEFKKGVVWKTSYSISAKSLK